MGQANETGSDSSSSGQARLTPEPPTRGRQPRRGNDSPPPGRAHRGRPENDSPQGWDVKPGRNQGMTGSLTRAWSEGAVSLTAKGFHILYDVEPGWKMGKNKPDQDTLSGWRSRRELRRCFYGSEGALEECITKELAWGISGSLDLHHAPGKKYGPSVQIRGPLKTQRAGISNGTNPQEK